MRTTLLAAAMLMALAPARAADTPLEQLVPRNSPACFARSYDAEHFKRFPDQATASIALLLEWDREGGDARARDVTVVMTRRGGGPVLQAVGTCTFSATGNLGPDRKRIIAKRNSDAAISCALEGENEGEDGGFVQLEPTPDGKALMLFTGPGMSVEQTTGRVGRAVMLEFGKDDRDFRLDRAPLQLCRQKIDNPS